MLADHDAARATRRVTNTVVRAGVMLRGPGTPRSPEMLIVFGAPSNSVTVPRGRSTDHHCDDDPHAVVEGSTLVPASPRASNMLIAAATILGGEPPHDLIDLDAFTHTVWRRGI